MHMALFWILGMAAHMGALLLYLMIASIVLISVHSLLNLRSCFENWNASQSWCLWVHLVHWHQNMLLWLETWIELMWYFQFNGCPVAADLHLASEVRIVGNAPWLGKLQRTLNAERRRELTRIKKFLKIKTTKVYQCRTTGRTKCAGVPILVGFQ